MKDILDELGIKEIPDFSPCVFYMPLMKELVYINEDVSCTARRIDDRMTLLVHPHDGRVIGVKLYLTGEEIKQINKEAGEENEHRQG